MISRSKNWTDHCNHDADTYVGSDDCVPIKRIGKPVEFGKIDVYVYHDPYYGHGVCIRDGNEGCDYHSPGSLFNLVSFSPQHEVYRAAVEILKEYGNLTFTRK